MNFVMLLMGLVHITNCEFGFPFRLHNGFFQETVIKAIQPGVSNLKSVLIRTDFPKATPFYANLSLAESRKLQYVGNVSEAFQISFQGLLRALNATKDPLKVVDNLNGSFNRAELLLRNAYIVAIDIDSSAYGSGFTRLANETLKIFGSLKIHADDIQNSILNVTRMTPIRAESVEKFLSLINVEMLRVRLRYSLAIINANLQICQRFGMAMKQLTEIFVHSQSFLDKSFAPLKLSISELSEIMNETVRKMNSSLMNANFTVFGNYSSLMNSGKLKDISAIKEFLSFISNSIDSTTSLTPQVVRFAMEPAITVSGYFRDVIYNNLGRSSKNLVTAIMTSQKNASQIDTCIAVNSLFNSRLKSVIQMGHVCIGKYRSIIPTIIQHTERLMAVMITIAIAAVKDMNLCLTFINEPICYENVLTNHFSEENSSYPAIAHITSIVIQNALSYLSDAFYSMDKCYEYVEGIMSDVIRNGVDTIVNCCK